MRNILLAPDPALFESMRAVGYTVETAVADVIDNSVAAGASQIEIQFTATGPFEVAVMDDGDGMNRDEAITAMKLAARSSTTDRGPHDLGRFGLGLKTASLSQCRTLTLVTRKDGELTALRWSLDHVIHTGNWSLIELDHDDVTTLLGWKWTSVQAHGTLVHWGDLDRLILTEGGDQADLDRVALRVRDHVALVFHLFNSGGEAQHITFSLNGSPIDPVDPFMSHLRLTTRTPWESITIDGEEVRLMAFTLPYLNRLSSAERAKALRLGSLSETQGFYVYRARRLVIWGTWFRVMPRSEMAKLTRVRVDIPNTLDHQWALDVKKSKADPPPQIRRRLSELARTMTAPSQRVQQFRGRRINDASGIEHLWIPRVNGDEFAYEINTEHPTVAGFVRQLPDNLRQQFQLVMEDLQTTFPVIDAHNRLSGDKVPRAADDKDLVARAVTGWELARTQGLDAEVFITTLARSDPYHAVPDFTVKLRKALA